MEHSVASTPRRRARPPRRPEQQQILIRRALALGAGLLVVILIIVGIKGCLEARAHDALAGYAGNVGQIIDVTAQTSQSFFGKLSKPGNLRVTEFIAEVNADRSAMGNYRARIDAIEAPGEMADPQRALKLVYELRDSAMARIAEKMSTALGSVGSKHAATIIARQMRVLMASDVLYAAVVRPEIDAVLARNGIEGQNVPKSVFLAQGTRWLNGASVSAALGTVSGATGTVTPGVHGLGLIATSVNHTELAAESTTTVATHGATPEVEVQVQNQGESTENGVAVSVTVNGGHTLQGTITSIAVLETATATIPLTPAPHGSATIEIDVHPVPGEQVTENNKATYKVQFE